MKPRRNYNKEALSLAPALAEGFQADVKGDFLTAGSAWLWRHSPRPSSLDGMLQTGFGRQEPAGRGLGVRQEPTTLPGEVLQCIYNGGKCWGAPQPPITPLCTKSGDTRLFGAMGWGRGISCLGVGDVRVGRLHALGSQTWCSLRKGKLRQYEMLWTHHHASGGRSCSKYPGRGSSPRCQLRDTGD